MFQFFPTRFTVIFVLIFPISTGFAQEFQFQPEIKSIPVIINGESLSSPFAGGMSLAHGTLVDIDNDGDMDLFSGEEDGDITFFRNTGTATEPAFTFETEKLVSIGSGFRSAPAFADIDNDGDFDLFVGEYSGDINFFRNTGSSSYPIFILESENLTSIYIGTETAPTLIDIDDDNDYDLFVGEKEGNLNFFRNTGTAAIPVFVLETENLDSIDVGSESAPVFVDIDNDRDLDLFVGEQDGKIHFYRNSGTAANPAFTFETDNYSAIYVEGHSRPIIADIDNDQDFDLFVGDRDGEIIFFRNRGTTSIPSFTLEAKNFVSEIILDLGLLSNATFVDIDNDADLDLFIGIETGNLSFFRNTGSATTPIFTLETESLISVADRCTPIFADIDDDGDFDFFSGEREGNLNLFRNTGSATNPIFALETNNFAAIDVGLLSTPALADIDNDGDLDLFIGERDGNINFYRNTGTATNPIFTLETENYATIDVGLFSTPTFTDIDQDGDLDLFIGENSGNINFFRNTGTPTNPALSLETESFTLLDTGYESAPCFVDIDGDGDDDFFAGEFDGGLYFYRNVTPLSVATKATPQRRYFILYQNYPNPFNPTTRIKYQLATASHVVLTIYNLAGQEIATAVNEFQPAGEHEVTWQSKGLPSGLYFYKIQAGEYSDAKKLILQK
ncbi:MAG: T9SS type A sorting domain-containing protein [bacterium]|nr:T9SS type A sorting domain-containing protein [bacterium]